MKNFDQNEFINDLLGVDWRGIVRTTDDINIVVNNWTKTFSLILEKHAPTRNRRVSDKFCPWLTNDFKLMCKGRDSTLSSPEVLLYLSDNLDMRVREGRGLKGGAATSPPPFFFFFYLNSTETQHG